MKCRSYKVNMRIYQRRKLDLPLKRRIFIITSKLVLHHLVKTLIVDCRILHKLEWNLFTSEIKAKLIVASIECNLAMVFHYSDLFRRSIILAMKVRKSLLLAVPCLSLIGAQYKMDCQRFSWTSEKLFSMIFINMELLGEALDEQAYEKPCPLKK